MRTAMVSADRTAPLVATAAPIGRDAGETPYGDPVSRAAAVRPQGPHAQTHLLALLQIIKVPFEPEFRKLGENWAEMV